MVASIILLILMTQLCSSYYGEDNKSETQYKEAQANNSVYTPLAYHKYKDEEYNGA